MSEIAERMRRMRKLLKENDELYQELNEKERKRQKIIRDQKKAERVENSVKLKQYREYERKRKAEQRKKKKIVEQDGRKASGKRTRRANLAKKNNQIQNLIVKVAKLTNHNRRLSRKLKKKKYDTSSPIIIKYYY